MSNGEPKKQPTITFIDEDEFQLYKLYRERTVQEDNLINHRMSWMVISQSFLLATFGFLSQKIQGGLPENIITETRLVCVVGVGLAVGSKFAIRAAQDEINELRAKYVKMYPPHKPDIQPRDHVSFWVNAADFRLKRYKEAYQEVSEIKESGSIHLPGMTGSRNFHLIGHLMPKFAPVILIALWILLFVNVKRDILHLVHKHWLSYAMIAITIYLVFRFVPKGAKKFVDRSDGK